MYWKSTDPLRACCGGSTWPGVTETWYLSIPVLLLTQGPPHLLYSREWGASGQSRILGPPGPIPGQGGASVWDCSAWPEKYNTFSILLAPLCQVQAVKVAPRDIPWSLGSEECDEEIWFRQKLRNLPKATCPPHWSCSRFCLLLFEPLAIVLSCLQRDEVN